jgi:hypothetical protein
MTMLSPLASAQCFGAAGHTKTYLTFDKQQRQKTEDRRQNTEYRIQNDFNF